MGEFQRTGHDIRPDRATDQTDGVRSDNAGSVLRRVRRLARLSQRELATRAGVATAVVSRIESGRTPNPGFVTMGALVRAAGFALDVAVADEDGSRRVIAQNPFEGLRDVAGRRLPAHVEPVVVRTMYEDSPLEWWAWRYRWSTEPGARVPRHTYTTTRSPYYRPPLDPVTGLPTRAGTILDWAERQRELRAELGRVRPQDLARTPWGRRMLDRRGDFDPVSTIGVFALQGDVREHVRALAAAGCTAVPVRRPSELAAVDGLVLPGGESTTMIKLARAFDLLDPLRDRIADGLPVYGSCAGMILLADRVDSGGSPLSETVGGLDITVRRNAFGRQVDSFEEDIAIDGVRGGPVRAVFIRAPWVQQVGPAATPLGATAAGHVVAVRQGPLLATSFHPEVTGDGRVHAYFCSMVSGAV